MLSRSVRLAQRTLSTKTREEPSYTLLVPNGWEAVTNKQGVKLSGGAGWGQLLVENGGLINIPRSASPAVVTKPVLSRLHHDYRLAPCSA